MPKVAKPSGSTNIAINNVQSSSSQEIGHMLIATLNKPIEDILLNCTATYHMFSNCQFFTSYNCLTDGKYITISSQHKILVLY